VARAGGTTSQPQKGACGQILPPPWGLLGRRHLVVGPIPPADWGTRSTRSHLGKRPEHESPDFCPRRGVDPGVRPVLGQVSPERAGAQGFGSESVPGGVPIGSTGGVGEGQNVASKAGSEWTRWNTERWKP
jgi:hypothetical protein